MTRAAARQIWMDLDRKGLTPRVGTARVAGPQTSGLPFRMLGSGQAP
jgi:hypothetical protein